MINYQKHFDRLQAALGIRNPSTGRNCVDIIDEQLWQEQVMKALNEVSIESAEELQKETGKLYPKDSLLKDPNGNIIEVLKGNQKYSEALPTRLLSMTLNLSYWLGFHDASNDHEMHKGGIGAWERIGNGLPLWQSRIS